MRAGGALLGLRVLGIRGWCDAVAGVAVRLLAFALLGVVALQVEDLAGGLVGLDQNHFDVSGWALRVLGVGDHVALTVADDGEGLALDGDHREPTACMRGQIGVELGDVEGFEVGGQLATRVERDDVCHLAFAPVKG